MRSSVTPPEISIFARPAIRAHGLADLLERQVVEQDDVGARVDRLLDIGKALRFDLDEHLLAGRLHAPDGFDDTTGEPDVVVLDQDGVVEARAVVRWRRRRAPRISRARAASAWSCACRGR